ncbi:apolipoprotein N-acyltransferase [Schumannella luteola]|uniref:Apolipoprotein N-acyltransferase n=1 Tax=Schumannella luteola TaxID=472059 RepID=A0A852YRQ0_9MICO|nr:apolipoprotein N-acyltransferase [Schumannella luteola]TPX05529.1 apolipoprotein N-acyltransferase [Schumannella luteola]
MSAEVLPRRAVVLAAVAGVRARRDGFVLGGRIPLLGAVLLAAAGGLLLRAAFPGPAIWILAFPAIALALVTLRGRRLGAAFLVGFVFGAAFWFPHIGWASRFLGVLPWTALATLMSLWMAGGAMLIALAYRWLPHVVPGRAGRLALLPAVVAGLWILREGVSSVWPYGGFSWGRVAFSQSESPFQGLFSWLGSSALSFLMVLLVAVAIEVALDPAGRRALRGAVVTAVALAVLVVPAFPTTPDGTLRVGAVQGDTKAGYFDPPENVGDNLLGQAQATEPVFDQKVDVVVWPEGASDVDPLRDGWAARIWDLVSAEADAPIVGGTITHRDDEYFNTSLLWKDGGAVDHYDKKHPVPFGEYIPDRAFWRPFAPDLIDLVQREYSPGRTDTVMDVGKAIAGFAICFDIVDDAIMRQSVDDGAQVILAQTNNADFGEDTDESVQQLAIAQVRALELGRSVVNISTVGTSAVVLPDGTVTHRLPTYEPGVIVDDVPLRTGTTPAVAIGLQLEWFLALGGLLLLAAAGIRSRLDRGAGL